MAEPLPFDTNDDGITLTAEQDTIPRGLLERAPSIEKLRKRFDEARQDPGEARIKAQKARDYYDGPKQLNSEVRTILKTRGQPPIYTNRVRPAVNGILGVLEASRSDPRAWPRNPDDDNSADVATKSLRYIADECDFDDTKMDVAENFLIEGTGAAIIEVIDDNRIQATQIRWEEFYADPFSRRADFADARFMGIAKWMDAAQIRERYKIRINEIGDPMSPQGAGIISDTWKDRPDSLAWVDRRRQRVMLVEEYHIEEGQWRRCVYIATGILEYDVSPYLDDKRRPSNPIEAESCYVSGGTNSQNVRYGMVDDMIPIQDEVNASRSRSLHLMNSRQVQQVDINAPPVDSKTARAEAAKADGVLPPGWQIVPTNDITTANMTRMQEAKEEIARMAPTPEARDLSTGTATSGRARLVAQQAGLTQVARPLGRFAAWELRVYRQMWNRARQYWQDPMWIRVTDEVKAPEYLKVNEPVTIRKAAEAAMQGDQASMQALSAMVPPEVLQAAMQGDGAARAQFAQFVLQYGQQPIMVKNRIAEMDMDIILDTTPDTANLQAEVFADLKEAIVGGLDIFSPQFEVLLEMSPLANKAEVLERLKAKREEVQQASAQQAQEQQQIAQRAQQLQEAGAVSEIEKTRAETGKIVAETEETNTDALATALGHLRDITQPQETVAAD